MISVKGKVEKGKILALEPVDERYEGTEVTILLGEVTNGTSGTEDESEGRQIRDDWDQLINTIHENQIHTGLKDMAHQHDHYLYGTPKLED